MRSAIRLSSIFLATFILSVLYGLSFMINIITTHLGGNAVDVGHFLLWSGVATILVVLFSGRLTYYLSAWWLLFIGSLSYSAGLLLLALLFQLGWGYLCAAIAIGIGWGAFYVAAPMVLSIGLSDQRRIIVFNYLAACIAAGAGLGPILFQWLHHFFNVQVLFGAAAVIGILDAILFLALYLVLRHAEPVTVARSESVQPVAIFPVYRNIFGSKVIYPIVLVFLGACVFTSMMYFQTVFAAAAGVNYSVFYLLFTVAMVVVRFTLSPSISKMRPGLIVFLLSLVLAASVFLFAFSARSAVFYGLAAVLFGVSYGLLYPLIKAISVNVSAAALHRHVIAVFTLSYFIGVYLFPWLMGHALSTWGDHAAMILMFIVAVLYMGVALLFCWAEKPWRQPQK